MPTAPKRLPTRAKSETPTDSPKDPMPSRAEVMEAHIREEFGQPATTDRQRAARVREMTALVRSYLK